MSSRDEDKLKVDGFEDISDIVGDDEDEGGILGSDVEEDELGGSYEPDYESSGAPEEVDEEEEDEDDEEDEELEEYESGEIEETDSSGGIDKKQLGLVAGVVIVGASVAGYVGYDMLKASGFIGQSNSGNQVQDSAPVDNSWMANNESESPEETIVATDSAGFDDFLGGSEAPEAKAPEAVIEDVSSQETEDREPFASIVESPDGKLSLSLNGSPKGELESSSVSANQIPKIGSPLSATSNIIDPPAQVISDPGSDVVEDEGFDANDFSYLRMEKMLETYAKEAGFVDNEKLNKELNLVRSDLQIRISNVEADVDEIKETIAQQQQKDVEHDELISSLASRLEAIESSSALKPKPKLEELKDRERLKGFKIISSSDDGKMVTAKTPSGKAQVFFEGEVLHVRGVGTLKVQKIEGLGQRVLVGSKYYFDEVHIDAPKFKPTKVKSKSSDSAKVAKSTSEPKAKEKPKSAETPAQNEVSYEIRESRGPKVNGSKPNSGSYVIAEKNPAEIAKELAEKGESVSYEANIAQGWILSGGDADRSSFLIKDPQGHWHVVKVGDRISELGDVRGITEKGSLLVGNFVIVSK